MGVAVAYHGCGPNVVITFAIQQGDPVRVGVAMTDLSTGLFAKAAILGALYHRERTGQGQKIDCNLLSTQVSSQGFLNLLSYSSSS